jgi:hypothetical protein
LSRDNATLERAARVLALCGAASEASSLANEVAKRFPEAILTRRVSLPVIAAAGAIQQRDPARGLELLEPVRPYDRVPSGEFWPTYLRGQAYLQLKDGHAARVQFQSIIDRRGEVPASILYPLAHLGLARAATLTNDMGTASKAYDDFLTFWKEADSTLQPLKEARLERSR